MLQPNGAQIMAGAGRQRPAPSQTWAPTMAAPSHVPPPHRVPASYFRQAPAPSQVPSSPHVLGFVAAQVLSSRGCVPAEANVQVPMAVGAEQVLHVSVQAVLQHTPSTQKLLAHSAEHPQSRPSSFCPRASTGQDPTPPSIASPWASFASRAAVPESAALPPLPPAPPPSTCNEAPPPQPSATTANSAAQQAPPLRSNQRSWVKARPPPNYP
jgi:hypothetical protein